MHDGIAVWEVGTNVPKFSIFLNEFTTTEAEEAVSKRAAGVRHVSQNRNEDDTARHFGGRYRTVLSRRRFRLKTKATPPHRE